LSYLLHNQLIGSLPHLLINQLAMSSYNPQFESRQPESGTQLADGRIWSSAGRRPFEGIQCHGSVHRPMAFAVQQVNGHPRAVSCPALVQPVDQQLPTPVGHQRGEQPEKSWSELSKKFKTNLKEIKSFVNFALNGEKNFDPKFCMPSY
jgi:hypothetical protein